MLTVQSRRKKTWVIGSLTALLLVMGGMAGVLVARHTANAALAEAIRYGQAPRARRLLRQGADPGTMAPLGVTLLIMAARTNDLPLLEESLARKVDVEATDALGMTPLMWASACGSVPAVEALLKAGANPSRVSPDGLTALSLCTTQGFSLREGTYFVFRQPPPHPGFARVAQLLKQHGAR